MYIVADIGGTKIRVAGSRDLNTFDDPVIFETPPVSYEEGLEAVVQHAHRIVGTEKIEAIAAGVPRLSSDLRTILPSRPTSNMAHWGGKPIADDLERALGAPVHLRNDATLVGLGEATAGAGAGANIVVYITVSTGVNGIRIVDGAIEPRAFAVSMGGQYVSMEEPLRSWENMISGRAIAERFGKQPYELGTDNPVWEELAKITAFGVHNSILFWSPDRVVLGGSMFNEIGISVPRVAAHVADIMKKFPTIPEIVHSSLGDLGGLWGGLALLRQRS